MRYVGDSLNTGQVVTGGVYFLPDIRQIPNAEYNARIGYSSVGGSR